MIKKINIGGQERPLDFNFNCLEEFEEITGIDPLNDLKINIKTAKVLLFCGLKYGLHPETGCDNKDLDFDVKKVGSWLDTKSMIKVLQAFNSQDHPEEKKKEEAGKPQVKN